MGSEKNKRDNKHKRHVFIKKPRKFYQHHRQNPAPARAPTPSPSVTPSQQSATSLSSSAAQVCTPYATTPAQQSATPSTLIQLPTTPATPTPTTVSTNLPAEQPATHVRPSTTPQQSLASPPLLQLPTSTTVSTNLPANQPATHVCPSTITPQQYLAAQLPLSHSSAQTPAHLLATPHLSESSQSSQRTPAFNSTNLQQNVPIEGSRIINTHQLQQYITRLGTHHVNCQGEVRVTGEVRQGLASILYTECTTCGHKIELETSEKARGPRGYMRWECNLAAVWGQMVTGGGHATLQETMSVLGVPTMTKKTFMATERDIGELWKAMLEADMIEAGKEEKRLAEERNDFHLGVPAITVIVDGGWSKRSHKHSYNAKSGVAVIFGQVTGKILHLGVRNKYCTACAQGIAADKHVCYKNWTLSSSEMETDIIVDGFKKAESKHGVRYLRFVGDGDSSVHPALLENVPVWGRDIKKLECANHACKCYRGSLEKLVSDNPGYKGKGGLTLKMRKKLTSAARCAIKMRSKEEDQRKGIRLLEQDLVNGPLHCFGYHQKCSLDFCRIAQQNAKDNSDPDLVGNGLQTEGRGEGEEERGLEGREKKGFEEEEEVIRREEEGVLQGEGESSNLNGEERMPSSERNGDLQSDLHSTIQEQSREQSSLWNEVMSEEELQANPTQVSGKLMHDIQVILSRLVAKAPQLIGNFTTNLAESWMHVRSKFDGGKVINRSQSGSWENRCMGAGLKHNLGLPWGPRMYTCMTSKENSVYEATTELSIKNANRDRKRKGTDLAKENRRKNKYSKTDNSVAARKAYSRHEGIQPDEASEDISKEHLGELKDSFYKTKVVLTPEEAKDLEVQTQNQADSELWIQERKKRITASNVGGICKMMKKTKRSKKVEALLYSRFKGNIATQYGRQREESSRQKYIAYQHTHGHPNLSTQATGLVVSPHAPWLGASPDDRVLDPDSAIPHGLAEYKNPYTAREFSISEACEKLTSFYLEKITTDPVTYKLKKRHNYHFQVQCQLFCDEKEWCDFVVNTEVDIHVERIYFDQKWWDDQRRKLHAFYFKVLLPELACPRHSNGGIREPTESE